jgi:phosphotransferase system IIB component
MLYDLNLILIILVIVVATLIPFIFLITQSKKKKSSSVSTLSLDFLENLVKSLGTVDNIKSISSEHQRIKVMILDLKLIQANDLKALGTPAFLKGKELTLLVKHHTKDVIDYINLLKREGN